MNCKRNRLSFTLVEVVVAVAIFSGISLALGGVFFSGLRLWQRFSGLEFSGNLIPLELEIFGRNLRRVVNYDQISFSGAARHMEYTAVLDHKLNKLIYDFDSVEKKLSLNQSTYRDFTAQDLINQNGGLIFSADALEFNYLIFDIDAGAYVWKDKTLIGGLPLAVRIYVKKSETEWERVVFLPLRL